MANFLSGLNNSLGTLVGGSGNEGAAASNAWNYGQYSPFTVNNPMGQTSFTGTTANQSLSPLQQQIQTMLGSSVQQGGAAAGGYNPNTSFLPQQYQQIFGNMQGNANTMFNNLQSAQQPWVQQGNSSNLDNEFSKGTLASTAGQYQTAGHDMSNNSLMQQNQATAQQYALQNAQAQFGAAQGTAGLGEQQQQFGAQQGLGLLNSGLNGLNQQNTSFLQQLQAAGNLGAQRSGANVSAAMPGIAAAQTQDSANAGLLSGLLFGGGTQGGLLSSLLGTNGGGGAAAGLGGLGSLLGKGLGSLFGGSAGAGTSSGSGDGGFGGDWAGYGDSGSIDSGQTQTDYGTGTTTQFGDDNWYGGFNSAGGEAAKSNPGGLGSVSGLSAGGLLSGLGGIASGVQKGGVGGGLQAAGSAAGLYNKVTGTTGGYTKLLGQAGQALNVYNGLTSGTPQGTVSGLASGAGLAASSGATGALGASAATTAAIGAAASGIGGVLAIPAVVQGVGGLIFNNLLGVDKPDKTGNELAMLRNNSTSGVTEKSPTANVAQGGFLGASAGAKSGPRDFYNGKDITVGLQNPNNAQKASDLFKSGDMAAYNAFMKTL
jgi:hypothetical protein